MPVAPRVDRLCIDGPSKVSVNNIVLKHKRKSREATAGTVSLGPRRRMGSLVLSDTDRSDNYTY